MAAVLAIDRLMANRSAFFAASSSDLLLPRMALCLIGISLPFDTLFGGEVIGGAILLLCAWQRRQTPSAWRPTVADLMFAALCLWRIASLAWSLYPEESLGALAREMPSAVLCYAGVRLTLVRSWRELAPYLFGSLLLSGMVALCIYDLATAFPSAAVLLPADDQVHDIVQFGTYLATLYALLLAIGISCVPAAGWRWAAAWFGSIVFVVATEFILRSRMFSLSLAVVSILALVWVRQRVKLRGTGLWQGAAVMLAALISVYAAHWAQVDRVAEFGHQAAIVPKVVGGERVVIYSHWLAWYREQGSWRGWGVGFWGPGRYIRELGLDRRDLADKLPPHELRIYFSHGHNVFMNALLQTGIVGVVLLAGFCLAPLAGRGRAGSGQTARKAFARWLYLLTLVVFLAKNSSDDGERGGGWVYFVVVAAACVAAARENATERSGAET